MVYFYPSNNYLYRKRTIKINKQEAKYLYKKDARHIEEKRKTKMIKINNASMCEVNLATCTAGCGEIYSSY